MHQNIYKKTILLILISCNHPDANGLMTHKCLNQIVEKRLQ
jgi:hypothetical protein